MTQTFKESRRITLAEYCPSRKVPLDTIEIMMQEVKREDEINHAGEPRIELPKYKEIKVEDPHWVKNLLKGTLGQLLP